LQDYMEKAAHEAKLRTSGINRKSHYDAAIRDFVRQVLTSPDGRFLDDFQSFHDSLVDSGLYTALVQVLLKLSCPGIPDVYQGQELWDFSLVDPDNRRPVDYARRRSLLDQIKRQSSTDVGRRALARSLAANPRDDRLKLFVTWTALQFRHAWPNLEDAEYRPLEIRGSRAEHACAFAWVARSEHRPRMAIVVAPRLIHTLTRSARTRPPCGFDVWQDTAVSLCGVPEAPLVEIMTGQPLQPVNGVLPMGTLLAEFPVALATTNDVVPHAA
jgi:(1->4)-alpha-D-glucan 1-alpha-D-glucosylmutase